MNNLKRKHSSESTRDFVRRQNGRDGVKVGAWNGEELGIGKGDAGWEDADNNEPGIGGQYCGSADGNGEARTASDGGVLSEGVEELGLCARCCNIDFDFLFDPQRIASLEETKTGFFSKPVKELLRLGTPVQWSQSSCQLCQFWYACFEAVIGKLKQLKMSDCADYQWSLVAFSFSQRNFTDRMPGEPIVIPSQDWGITFALVPLLPMQQLLYFGSVCYVIKNLPQREIPSVKGQVIGRFMDNSLPRKWLVDCLTHHDCTTNRLARGDSNVPVHGMRLVDCRSRTIVVAKASHDYVALSYVWGAGSSNESVYCNLGTLPPNLPQTVEDAITLTTMLGMGYLWIDRLCITNNAEAKHEQIAGMDKIYQQALLTIIAVSGNSASYGLHGVSRPRIDQPQIQIGSHHLISTLASARSRIESSIWATRGWTYQEALLSKRKLFFSDQQIYYECGSLCRHETWESNDEVLHSSKFAAEKDMSITFVREVPIYNMSGRRRDLHQIIERYAARMLTYDSDALNGCLGILRAYSRREQPQYHFCGMLVPDQRQDESHTVTFLRDLGWYDEPRDLQLPFPSRPRTRRKSQYLPSWCWTAWDTPVSFRVRNCLGFNELVDVNVCFETVAGNILSWETGLAMIKNDEHDLLSIFLHLDVWTWKTTFRLEAGIFRSNNGSMFLDLTCNHDPDTMTDDLRYRLLTDVWTCIIIERLRVAGGKIRTKCLVVDWKGDIAYRIGLIHCDIDKSEELTKRKIKLG